MKAYQYLWIFSVCYNSEATAAADVATEKEPHYFYSTLLFPNERRMSPENESFYTKSPFSDDERECRNQKTSYVYFKNLCGATDLQKFLQSSKEEYTCADRCGWGSTFGIKRECACDDKCEIYGDCCRDFSAVCPELHSQASVVYSHLKGAFAACEEASMVLLGMIKSPFSENVSDDKVSDQIESTVPQSSSMSMVITKSYLTDTHILNVVSMESLDIWWHNNFKWYRRLFRSLI